MLKIGDFSRLAQVSIKMLRHYDDIGLLKPAHIDRFTSYRYYTLDQLPRINRILALKDLGLSLEQIAQMLEADLKTDAVREMLRLKLADLHQELVETEARLTRIENRLKQIELEDKMPDYEIVLKKIEAQRVLSFREIVPAKIEPLFEEVKAAVREHRIQVVAPWLAIYHHAGYRERDLDLEVAIPISESVREAIPLSDGRQMTIRVVPAMETVICAVWRGDYNGLGGVYTALTKYLTANGYNYLGPAREVYLRGPGDTDDPTDYLTEVQYPIGQFQGETVIDGVDVPEDWKDTRPIRAHHFPFSRRARTALGLAEIEAAQLQQAEVNPAHLLLGLLRERESLAAHVLEELGVSLEQSRSHMINGQNVSEKTFISDAARQIISFATIEAQHLGHDYIGTEHLLLGLIKQNDLGVMSIFTQNNLDSAQVRAEILALITK
jgi:DNA-binding transcriptional MerR regulator